MREKSPGTLHLEESRHNLFSEVDFLTAIQIILKFKVDVEGATRD